MSAVTYLHPRTYLNRDRLVYFPWLFPKRCLPYLNNRGTRFPTYTMYYVYVYVVHLFIPFLSGIRHRYYFNELAPAPTCNVCMYILYFLVRCSREGLALLCLWAFWANFFLFPIPAQFLSFFHVMYVYICITYSASVSWLIWRTNTVLAYIYRRIVLGRMVYRKRDLINNSLLPLEKSQAFLFQVF